MKYADASVSQYLKRMIKQIKMNRFTAIQHLIQVNLNRPQLLVKMAQGGGGDCEMLLTTKVVITSNAEKSKFKKTVMAMARSFRNKRHLILFLLSVY